MHLTVWKFLHNFFTLLCILTTIALVIWCCYEFSKNEDVCEILFKNFQEDKDSRLPELTFGLPNRFNETALRRHNHNFNENDYRHFVAGGDYWDEQMLDIDFKDVTMLFEDYQIETCFCGNMISRRRNVCENQTMTIKQTDIFQYSFFTLKLPLDMAIYSATVKIKSSIFFDGIRPADGTVFAVFSYPNQVFSSISSSFKAWPVRTNTSTKHYRMKFTLNAMEVIRRRPKNEEECYPVDYDSKIMENIIENEGCSPLMWFTNRSEPLCRTRNSFKEIHMKTMDQLFRFEKKKKYLEPCLDIEKLQIDFVEENIPIAEGESGDGEEGWFELDYVIPIQKFKEIKQARKYSVQSLVGNLGGYIGLFLGYAIVNIPTMTLEIWKNIRKVSFSQANESNAF